MLVGISWRTKPAGKFLISLVIILGLFGQSEYSKDRRSLILPEPWKRPLRLLRDHRRVLGHKSSLFTWQRHSSGTKCSNFYVATSKLRPVDIFSMPTRCRFCVLLSHHQWHSIIVQSKKVSSLPVYSIILYTYTILICDNIEDVIIYYFCAFRK